MHRLLPNALSIARLACAPAVLVATAGAHSSLAVALVLATVASDVADGHLSRRFGVASAFGARLDACADFAVTFAAVLGLWSLGLYPWWLAPLLVFACAQFLLVRRDRAGRAAPRHEAIGRHTGTLLYGGVLVTLIAPDTATINVLCTAVALLVGATTLSVSRGTLGRG